MYTHVMHMYIYIYITYNKPNRHINKHDLKHDNNTYTITS